MAMTVKKKSDIAVASRIIMRIADIPGGVTVKNAEIPGDVLKDATVISAPDSNGITHLVKWAIVQAAAAANATAIRVQKGSLAKVGELFGVDKPRCIPATITAINTTQTGYDTFTLDAALGVAVAVGDVLHLAAAAAVPAPATVQADATDAATSVYILKGHNIEVGDAVCKAAGVKATAVSAIDRSAADRDKLTVAALGYALTAGDTLQIAKAAADEAELKVFYAGAKYSALAITGTPVRVEADTNIVVDAYTHATVKGTNYPAVIAAKLKGIVEL
jgi:hypothetical protein